ncbi:MAG: RNA-binding protein [Nitrosarchaeum sp.]|nr:RNA-binding protein [Nitrosarchaeum sp.]
MSQKVYVGNLTWGATEDDVKDLFSPCGNITSVTIIKDRDTGRSRGFCFVEMDNIQKAIEELNGREFQGRKLVVNEARERERTPRR